MRKDRKSGVERAPYPRRHDTWVCTRLSALSSNVSHSDTRDKTPQQPALVHCCRQLRRVVGEDEKELWEELGLLKEKEGQISAERGGRSARRRRTSGLSPRQDRDCSVRAP